MRPDPSMTHSTARLSEPWMLPSRRTDPNAVHMGSSALALIGTPSCAGDNGSLQLRRTQRVLRPQGPDEDAECRVPAYRDIGVRRQLEGFVMLREFTYQV